LVQKALKAEPTRADGLGVTPRSRALCAALALAIPLAVSPASQARSYLPPHGKVFTGVAMGYDLSDFLRRTGHRPAVWEQFVAFEGGYSWALRLARQERTRVMLAITTAPDQNRAGTISPGQIAAGRGDRWLVRLRRDLGDFGGPAYVRFLGEMNNCHNAYAPLSCTGASRGASYSARSFVRAWRRAAVIMRGTSGAPIDARLRQLHQRPLRVAAGDLGPARIAMVWSPMTGGSPLVGALDPARFWPGRRWVDWVGTSFYSKFPRFAGLSGYYSRFAARYRLPFMFAEWAMWDNGDPGFVRGVLGWTRSHRRTRMIVYNQGKRTNGPFRLVRFPSAASVLRRGLQARLFL
jgi:hypothetical protein